MKSLGEQVKEARRVKKMTQETLANRAGISKFAVQAMEAGRSKPTLDVLFKVTRELLARFDFDCGGTTIVVTARARK